MFLTHGLNKRDELIPVDVVSSGRTSLTCPYCGQGLIARKGRVLAWHFAHDGKTCRNVSQDNDRIIVPFYDRFDLGLSKRIFDALAAVHDKVPFSMGDAKTLQALGFIEWNQFAKNGRGDWQLTHKGHIHFGEATLPAFANVQQESIASKHERLTLFVDMAAHYEHLDHAIAVTDLRLYRAQLARLLKASLYLMEITGGDQTLYKIGLTGRTVDERAAEVQAALQPFLGHVKVTPLRVLTGRGLVERYALHRWRKHQHTIGKMTEFFELENRRRLLSEFTRLGDLTPSELEADIIARDGKLPGIAANHPSQQHG